ncbi:Mitochondrial fusion and transport protein [Yarrowia sp. B02]|nr:Mitochondrial fusion and transport protein [Yarrowia sp. B02]
MATDNTLRPYYNADSFGQGTLYAKRQFPSFSESPGATSGSYSHFEGGNPRVRNVGNHNFGDLFDGIEIDYDISGTSESVRQAMHSLFQLYGKTFLSQPWEVSKLLLQVGDWSHLQRVDKAADVEDHIIDVALQEEEEREEDEEIDYFESNHREMLSPGHTRNLSAESPTALDSEPLPDQKKRLKKFLKNYHSQLQARTTRNWDILLALNEVDGVRGPWRALNASFLLGALTMTLEAWFSGFFSSLSNSPDPLFLEEVAHSPTPITSIVVAVSASVVTSLLVAPLDLIRTRLIVSTLSTKPRSVRQSLMELKSLLCPPELLVPTFLGSFCTSVVRHTLPLWKITKLGIDSYHFPVLDRLFNLASAYVTMIVKLPLETMLRRAQVNHLDLASSSMIVKPVVQTSTVAVWWHLLSGQQPLEDLYRGWRVSALGVLGEWGVASFKSVSKAGREKF